MPAGVSTKQRNTVVSTIFFVYFNRVTFKDKLVKAWELNGIEVWENLSNYQYKNLESSFR